MTDDNSTMLRFGGVPLHELLTSGLPRFAEAIVTRLVEQLPAYSGMPDEEINGDIVTVIDNGIRAFANVLRAGQLPTGAQLRALRESAARRAEEGVPLDTVISAYHIGANTCVSMIADTAGPADIAAVFGLSSLLTDYLGVVTSTVAAGYFEERQRFYGDEHAARQTLLSTLLDDGPAEDAADRAGLRLPSRYLVLGMRIGRHSDEDRSDVDSWVAARRKLRRLRVELERHSGDPVLHTLAPDSGIALIPDTNTGAELAENHQRWLSYIVTRLMKVAGVPVHAGIGAAAPNRVATVAREAREIGELAQRFARPPGVYRLTDLMLEYQLTRPGPARDAFAALLDPLTGKPELLETLRAYLANSLSRRQTAALLRVHPNTVDYRMRKVAQLTGLDPSRPIDLPRITAALAAASGEQRP